MPTRIKNCGLSDSQTIDHAAQTGAGFAGFVHHPSSPRHVTIEAMAKLVNHARPLMKTVAVLSNPTNATLDSIAAQVKPDFLQIHGIDELLHIQSIATRYGIPIITGIAVRSESDLTLARSMEEISTYLLFDAPSSGSGQAFDWRILKNLPMKKRWFLAGGLTPDNVAEAMRITGAPMVDVSSGIEEPMGSGTKSLEKIAAFNAAVLNAGHA